MKDNRKIVLIICLALIFIYLIFHLFASNPINQKILNKNWYRYDRKTGYYEILNIKNESFSYNIPTSSKDDGFESCKKYNYNESSQSLNLDCNKVIKIENIGDNTLTLSIGNQEKVFFTDINSSLNYEFENFFRSSIAEYSENKEHVKNLIKIETNKIFELYNDKEESTIVMVGNDCVNVDCILFMDILEQWISLSEDVYFIDSSVLTYKDTIRLNKLNKEFSSDINDYNLNYPLIYKIGNKNIIETFEIKCNGFDCSKYKIK